MATVYFLDVGCADCTIIKSNLNTHIIDCNNQISNYKNLLPDDKKIRSLFITHQHYDHFEGLHYLFENKFVIEYIIISPYERRYNDNSVKIDEWNDCKNIVKSFEDKGTKIYKVYRQDNFKQPFWTIDNLNYWMIGPSKSIATEDTREIHDASLVMTLMTTKKCVFTGDASDKSLNWISKNTNHFSKDILHASHHGSLNGADIDFIKKCSPDYTIISTKSGVHESVPDATALRRYKENTSISVYRTDVDGSKTFEL